MSDVGCRMSDVGCRMSDIGHRTSGIGYRVSGIGYRLSDLYLIASFRLTPALNPGIFRAFTLTVRPVNTLLTSRALWFRLSNVPKPAIVTFPPRLICFEMTPS